MSFRDVAAFAAIVILAASCGGRSSAAPPGPRRPKGAVGAPKQFRTLALPGFSVDVPLASGTGTGSTTSYESGHVELAGNERFVMITWSFGPGITTDELPTYVQANASVVWRQGAYEIGTARTITVGDRSAATIDASLEGAQLSMTSIECGRRHVTLMIGASNDFSAVNAHILGSFVCTPSVSEEEVLGGQPFETDDPGLFDGWTRVPDDTLYGLTKDGLTIGAALISGDAPVTVSSMSAVMPEMAEKMWGGTWTANEIERRRTVNGVRELQSGVVEIGTERAGAVYTIIRCDGGILMAFGFNERSTDTGVLADLLTRIRCKSGK